MTILITGVAGFIGAALAQRCLQAGYRVVGLDNFNDYYSPLLKRQRVAQLVQQGGDFRCIELDLTDANGLTQLVQDTKPTYILHLAAQASVRYAAQNPQAYLQSNLIGQFNLLEAIRAYLHAGGDLQHFINASTSSVYGGNEKVPFAETDDVSRPVSLYAATKRADELITYSYCHNFGVRCSSVRFFTVYGPWGRPDMSPWIFASKLLQKQPIPLFNQGDLWRDFTYVADVVEGVFRLLPHVPVATNASPAFEVYNIGNSQPVQLLEYVQIMGEVFGQTPILDLQDWPATEVYKTYADTSKLEAAIGWKPGTDLRTGLTQFAEWFVPYFTDTLKAA